MKVRQTPDYVRRGTCSDCLVVWSRRERELIEQIVKLQKQVQQLQDRLELQR